MAETIWTIEALKDYVDRRFAANEQAVDKAVGTTALAVDKAFEQNQRAIDKAEEAVEKRLEAMNEFRDQLTNERSNYVSAESYRQQHGSLEAKIEALDKTLRERLTTIEQWQNKIVGALVLILVILPALTALAVYLANR